MSLSITVKNKQNKAIELTLVKHHLEIKDTTTKELVSFDHIYAIQSVSDTLLISIATPTEQEEPQQQATIRPPPKRWIRRTLEYQGAAAHFVTQLQQQALPKQPTFQDTQIHVIVNPTAGQRRAEQDYAEIVLPMLRTAGFQQIHKCSKAQRTQLDADAIVIGMGGDGTLHDLIHQYQGPFRLGVIPAGSGNAFALGLGIESIEHAVLKIIHGKHTPCYNMRVQLGHATQDQDWEDHVVHDTDPIQLLVVMSWGFHAQVVSKARYLRYLMGNQRFSWVAMFLLKFLYQYEGELVLNHVQQYCLGEWQPEQDKIKLTQEKKFTYFLVSKQHSLEKGFKITPFASALTEDMDVLVLRDVDADTLTKASMDAFQGGQHVNSLEVEYFKAKQVLLRVKEKAELCLDGEIHQLPAKGVVDLQVISSGFTVFN